MEPKRDLLEMVAAIVASYAAANPMPPHELSTVIRTVHATLKDLSAQPAASAPTSAEPAVSIKRSITPDHLICLEDGKKFKSLKRHLRTRYGMTPDEYRTKWGLPPEYPMVAPNYARERSNLAKKMGLGHARKSG